MNGFADTAARRWRRLYARGERAQWPPSAAGECRTHGEGQKGTGHRMVSCPLLTPLTFLRTRLPSVARLNARGPQGRLVLQGSTLDRSGAFRSGTLPPCTVWPRTVMRGKSRKLTSGHNSVPKSARRTEPSPRNPRFAAHLRCVSAKEGEGSQEGTGNHTWCPVPFCLRRQTAAFPPVNTGNPPPPKAATAHAHPEHKSPSSGTPLYPKQKQPFRKLQKQEQKPLLWMKQKWKSTKLR